MSNSEEEEIARNYICFEKPNCTVVVVDATSLERNLNLVYQILEITNKVVVCVNLLDEARKKGININLEKLEKHLGVPVVGTIARKKKTLINLMKKIEEMCNKKIIESKAHIELDKAEEDRVLEIFNKAREVCKDVVEYKNENYNERDRKIDKILTSKKFGIPIMIFFLIGILWITIVGANYPSKFLSELFSNLEVKLIYGLNFIGAPVWLTGILIDGIYKTLTWVVAVMLPPMAIFFPLFTLLEDFGYLPRISFNLDNYFKKCGTTGKQALTMCMGFGCNAAGVVGCRIIDSVREKIIAILTNVFVPCNGRFPFLITISSIFIGASFITPWNNFISALVVVGIVLFGIVITLIMSKILSKTILKGEQSPYILELPPYRKPQIGKIIVRSIFDRTLFVLGRAAVIAIPAGIVIWIAGNVEISGTSILMHIANFLDPFANLMGLDGVILTAFILSLPANEIVLPIILMCYMSSGVMVNLEDITSIGNILIQNGWTIITAINVMLFSLLHFPCSTTLLTIKKESGSLKWMMLAFMLPTICGIIICLISNGVYNLIV